MSRRPLNRPELALMAAIFDCTPEVCRCGEHRDAKRIERRQRQPSTLTFPDNSMRDVYGPADLASALVEMEKKWGPVVYAKPAEPKPFRCWLHQEPKR